jgi:hypothetical protein
MADKYSDSELVEKVHAPGWAIDAGNSGEPVTGTLADVAKAAHEEHAKGTWRGFVREVETEVELDMIQLSMLWRYLGLPT